MRRGWTESPHGGELNAGYGPDEADIAGKIGGRALFDKRPLVGGDLVAVGPGFGLGFHEIVDFERPGFLDGRARGRCGWRCRTQRRLVKARGAEGRACLEGALRLDQGFDRIEPVRRAGIGGSGIRVPCVWI